MGLLAFLWYHSQNILLEEKEITSEIIKDAIHSDDDKVLDALISSGFIKENNDYTYTICGMKEQVDGILAYRTMKQSAGKRGGERSAEKRSKTKQNEAGA
jgi:enhancing lycopene biosynthesis protein 2